MALGPGLAARGCGRRHARAQARSPQSVSVAGHALRGQPIPNHQKQLVHEIAGYAGVMETIFAVSWVLPLTENHIRQLRRDLLRYSTTDDRHRGEYKKLDNHQLHIEPLDLGLSCANSSCRPVRIRPRRNII